jgi:CRP-like cAMP-binding protein
MIRAGELLFEEGEVGELAFLIISGAVEIFRKSGNQERVLATLGRGEMIGEMSLIDNQPRIASARALQDTEVRVISRDSLQQRLARLEQTDRVLRRLIAVLVSRIRGQAQSPG